MSTLKTYWKKDLPIQLYIPRKRSKDKKVELNLNLYRNIHWGSESENKQYFTDQFSRLDWFDFNLSAPLKFYYFIHIQKDIADLMNVGSILDKYLCDTLVSIHLLKDDNITILNRCEFIYDYTIEKSTFDFCMCETASLASITNLKKELGYDKETHISSDEQQFGLVRD